MFTTTTTQGVPKKELAKMKLTPMMMQHIDRMSTSELLTYFRTDISPAKLPKPLVAADLETPMIGDVEGGWSWDCAPTLWSFYSDEASVVDCLNSLIEEETRRLPCIYDSGALLSTDNGAVFRYCEEVHRRAIQWLLDETITVWHNSSFDLQRLGQRGYKLPLPGCYQDTMLMAYQLNYPGVALADLAPLVGMVKVKASKKDFAEVSQVAIQRNLSDTEITFKLFHYLVEEMQGDPRVLAHYQYVDLPYSALIREMEDAGFYLDLGKLREFHNELTSKLEALKAEVAALGIEVPANCAETMAFRSSEELETLKGRLEPEFCVIDGDGRNDEFTYHDYSKPTKKQPFTRRPRKGTYAYRLIKPFNPESGDHVLHALQLQGWEPGEAAKKTDSGKLATDKEVLKTLAKQFPLAAQLLEISKYSKLVSTYTENFLTRATEVAPGVGLLRGGFNQAVTATGRLSSSNPNLQNIPSKGDLGKRMRGLFRGRPGYAFLVGDDGQIEARIFADYAYKQCDEPRLVELFQNPELDFHMENGINWGLVNLSIRENHPDWSAEKCRLFEQEIIEGYRKGTHTKDNCKYLKEGRDTEKTALYGVLYGAGATKLGNGDLALGLRIVDAMVTNMPALKQLKDKVWHVCEFRRGYVYNMWGRRNYYPDIQCNSNELVARAKRQIFNSVIQGSSASRMFTKMLQAWAFFKTHGCQLAGAVHDEYLFYAPVEHAEKVAQWMSDHFSSADSMPVVPVEFEFKIVDSWAAKG